MAPRWRMPPLLRFLSLGLALWLGKAYAERLEFFVIEAPSEQSLEISYRDWAERAGVYPDERQRKKIVVAEIEDRALFKEALRQKLHRDDPIVNQRLLRNAEFIGIEGADAAKIQAMVSLKLHLSDEIIRRHLIEKLRRRVRARVHPVPAPSDDVLYARYLAEHDRWTREASVEIEHIFFSADSADMHARAAAAGARLSAVSSSDAGDAGDAVPYSMGDRFLLGNRLPWMEVRKIRDMFGSEIAELVERPPTVGGATPTEPSWSGPVRSPYGVHFVRVISYQEQAYRLIDEVRSILIHEHERALEREALKAYVSDLLVKYQVEGA